MQWTKWINGNNAILWTEYTYDGVDNIISTLDYANGINGTFTYYDLYQLKEANYLPKAIDKSI